MAKGELEFSPIWQDVKDVLYSGTKQTRTDYTAMVHTVKDDFVAGKILEIEEMRDYIDSVSETVHIRFLLGMGDYVYKLYPYRENLEFTVKKIPLTDDDKPDRTKKVLVQRYKAILSPNKNPQVTSTLVTDQDINTLNNQQMVEVTLELQDRRFEPLRIKTTRGGVFRNLTAKRLIYAMLLGESLNVLVDGQPPVDGMELYDPDNKDVIPDFFVPSGMKISMLPTYIQEKLQGVYNTGIGTFFQSYKDKTFWFVYPTFNYERFDEDVNRMVIYAVPEDRFPGVERTYKQDKKLLHVLVTGDRSYYDSAKITDLNQGVGFRMVDANAIMKKPVLMTPDGPQAARSRLNFEVGSRERQDGLYYAPTIAPSANPFRIYSQLNGRNLARMNVAWENSRSDLVYPGMPCKYVFMDKDEYIQRRGIVCGCYTVTTLVGPPTTSSTYRTSSHLSLLVEPNEKTPPKPAIGNAGIF